VKGESATAKFKQACAAQARGQVTAAYLLYDAVLRIDPKHAGALHELALISAKTGDLRKAADLLDRAASADPRNPAIHNNRALALQGLGRWPEALASLDRALALRADYPEALYNRGNAMRALGDLPAALESYERAIAADARMVPAHLDAGLVSLALGRLESALESFERVLALEPANPVAWCNRGNVMAAQERWEEALAALDRAATLQPRDPNFAFNRGNVLKEMRRWEEALAAYALALDLRPGFAAAHFNSGVIHQELQRWDAALAAYDLALAAQPDYPEVLSNRGNVLRELGRCAAAVASYDRALALDPNYADAHWNRGIAALLSGDLAAGWPEYEWRWRRASSVLAAPSRGFTGRRWTGAESLEDRTILIHHEQGLGDALQFCRYVGLLAQAGARTVLETPRALTELLAQLDGVDEVVAVGSPLPACDYHCPLMSLPLAFRTDLATVPAPHRYLRSPEPKRAAWQAKLGPRRAPRIGLVWSGNTGPHTARNRSLPLRQWLPFLPPGFEYLSLQKELNEADESTLREHREITDFRADLLDFTDTAALCECLDLVISIDTSVAHLAGALGRPTWVLLQFSPDWRWLLGRDDSPWYPSARLFRQSSFADWNPVLSRVREELQGAFP
jgi:tetratricopeptide (TPR) repeat protein